MAGFSSSALLLPVALITYLYALPTTSFAVAASSLRQDHRGGHAPYCVVKIKDKRSCDLAAAHHSEMAHGKELLGDCNRFWYSCGLFGRLRCMCTNAKEEAPAGSIKCVGHERRGGGTACPAAEQDSSSKPASSTDDSIHSVQACGVALPQDEQEKHFRLEALNEETGARIEMLLPLAEFGSGTAYIRQLRDAIASAHPEFFVSQQCPAPSHEGTCANYFDLRLNGQVMKDAARFCHVPADAKLRVNISPARIKAFTDQFTEAQDWRPKEEWPFPWVTKVPLRDLQWAKSVSPVDRLHRLIDEVSRGNGASGRVKALLLYGAAVNHRSGALCALHQVIANSREGSNEGLKLLLSAGVDPRRTCGVSLTITPRLSAYHNPLKFPRTRDKTALQLAESTQDELARRLRTTEEKVALLREALVKWTRIPHESDEVGP